MEIRFEERKQLKEKPDQKHLGFGKYMTDYMFIMDWDKDQGWHDARIVPQGPIELDPVPPFTARTNSASTRILTGSSPVA